MSKKAIVMMDQASDKLKIIANSLNALGKEAGSVAQNLQRFGLIASSVIDGAIVTEEFPELSKRHDNQAGTREYSSPQAARVHFTRVMWLHGYRPGGNHTWLKAGFAAVMEP